MEYQTIYKSVHVWWKWGINKVYRILIPIKSYNHEIVTSDKIKVHTFLPLRPYMNNTGFKL